jgi:N-acyl-D-aspartate/D-glutamate deacylase
VATTLIEDGLIVDGTGAAPFRGSVLIAGERIAAVIPHGSAAALPPADARVCAAGALVAPGFVDAHAHSDAYLILEPSAPSKLTQGITTEINGQCG